MQLRRPGSGRDLLEQVEVRGNRYLTYPELGIGATADRVVAALGPPRERTGKRLVYACGAEVVADEPVVFLLEADRVAIA